VVARACILATDNSYIDNATDLGTVTVGGCRAQGISRTGGIFQAFPTRAARDQAQPFASAEALEEWASEQAELISASSLDQETKVIAASVVRSFAGNIGDLPIAWWRKGWLNRDGVRRYAEDLNEIVIMSDASKSLLSSNRTLEFLPEVLAASPARYSGFDVTRRTRWEHPRAWRWADSTFHFWTMEGAVIEAIAESWRVPISQLLNSAQQSTDEQSVVRVVAHDSSGEPITTTCDVLTRPELS
jgi:hypothetical protein